MRRRLTCGILEEKLGVKKEVKILNLTKNLFPLG